MNKMRITYDDWLKRYKDKTIESITLKEHKYFHKQFKAWQIGNIEKVY